MAGAVWLAVSHVLTGLLLFVTIIGIPLGVASFKMAGLALWPYGRMVVPIPRDGAPPNAVALHT